MSFRTRSLPAATRHRIAKFAGLASFACLVAACGEDADRARYISESTADPDAASTTTSTTSAPTTTAETSTTTESTVATSTATTKSTTATTTTATTSTTTSSTKSTSSTTSTSTTKTTSTTTTTQSSTTCSFAESGFPSAPAAGSGSFTWYYFGQGSYQTNGHYQTACGYEGSETTNSGQNSVDDVNNIANSAYFVAIPGSSSTTFENVAACGACVQITNGSKSVVATVIDECPASSNTACTAVTNPTHLDVSTAAFNQLGFSTGDPSGTTWKFVPCPVTGGVVLRVKSGNPNEIYIENVIMPVASVTCGGQSASRTSYGSWHFGSNLSAGASCTLKDIDGASITVTLSSVTQDQNQQTSTQFPTCN